MERSAHLNVTRVVLGLFAAASLPYSLPYVGVSPVVAVAVSAGFGGYVVGPLLREWRGWMLLAVLLVWAVLLARWRFADRVATSEPILSPNAPSGINEASAPGVWRVGRRTVSRLVMTAGAVATLLTFSLMAGASETSHALELAIIDDRISIVLSGFLIAVFVGHWPVVLISSHFSDSKIMTWSAGLPIMDRLGIAIGWFERALIFIFVVGGQVDGAALALTAKSLARYPALEREEINGEYFLVGTFSSVLVAMVVAIITRACIGLPPI
jgi:hypothetical protein